jgi:hypothetical protein
MTKDRIIIIKETTVGGDGVLKMARCDQASQILEERSLLSP